MFKKTNQTNVPKVIPMTTNNSNVVPMEVDDSRVIPLQVEETPALTLTEEDFIPSSEAIEAAKPAVVLVKDQVVEAQGKTCRVVEVVADNRYHLKNINEPYDSFIVTGEELV